MPKDKESTVKLQSFTSPLDVYERDSWGYTNTKKSLNTLMSVFQDGIDETGHMQDVNYLYQEKDPRGTAYIDKLASPIVNAGLGLKMNQRPTVDEMMNLAKNVHIVEDDGRVVTYADKYFNNKTVDMLRRSEKNGKAYGSLMAVHMGLFFSMKERGELESFEKAFDLNNQPAQETGADKKKYFENPITPGVTRTDEPPRVFITLPKEKPIAVVGSNLTAALEDLEHPDRSLFKYEKLINEKNSQISTWTAEMLKDQETLDRRIKEYEKKGNDLKADLESKKKEYEDWEKNYDSAAEREKLQQEEEKKFTDWEQEYDKNYQKELDQLQQSLAEKEAELKGRQDNPPTIPPEPKEGLFRRFLMFVFRADHSAEYKGKMAQREQAQMERAMWESKNESLQGEIDKTRQLIEGLKYDREQARNTMREEVNAAKEKIPSAEELKNQLSEQKKAELLDGPQKAIEEYNTKDAKEIEDTKRIFGAEIKRMQDRIDRTKMELGQANDRNQLVMDGITDRDKIVNGINNLTNRLAETSEMMLDKINPKLKLTQEYVQKKLNNATIQQELDDNKAVNTLGKGATWKMLEMINLKADRKYKRQTGEVYAPQVIGALDPSLAEKMANNLKGQMKNGMGNKEAEKEAKRLAMNAYERKTNEAVYQFEKTFGVECNPENVQAVAESLDLEGNVKKLVTKKDGKERHEYDKNSLPKANDMNYKDIALLTLCGVKTAVEAVRNNQVDIADPSTVKVTDASPKKGFVPKGEHKEDLSQALVVK